MKVVVHPGWVSEDLRACDQYSIKRFMEDSLLHL